jgi:putative radical SAM enzyme (TIGR03279 family)
MLRIDSIVPGSIAEELGLLPGDTIIHINDEPINDQTDFLIEETVDILKIELLRQDGEVWEIDLEHDPEEPLGLVFPEPTPKQCGNQCIFCFVHQLPKGMRKSLYIKDEDYRFSYLYGAYVTLTNLSEADLERIARKKMSPLFISVHATDKEIRNKLLGKPVPDIVPIMEKLVKSGIELHTQVVLCPQINDGTILEQTLEKILELGPKVLSLAVVPVGLTGHREHLPRLRVPSVAEARDILNWVEKKQNELLSKIGTRFVFAADEFYIKAKRPFPPLESYENLPQLENGIGLIPLFRKQVQEVVNIAKPLDLPPVSLVTGESAAKEIQAFAELLRNRCHIDLRVHVVSNLFFGGYVSVAGLLTGRDLINQLGAESMGDILLVPDVMLRDGQSVFLDDLTTFDLSEKLSVEVEIIPSDAWGVWDMLEILDEEYAGRLSS